MDNCGWSLESVGIDSACCLQDFPERLKAIATSSDVHTIVYPRYKTSGYFIDCACVEWLVYLKDADRDFNVAVHNLQVWLQDQVKQQQTSMASSGQTGNVLVVLLGHSMGGLVCKYFIDDDIKG